MEAKAAKPSSDQAHWSGERGAAWLDKLLEEHSIPPCRALVPGADMSHEAIALARRGFHTIVVDPDASELARVRQQAGKLDLIDTVKGDPFIMRPSFFGSVEFIYDRTLFHHAEPVERAAWGHLMSRVLPNGGTLAGLFLVGRGTAGPPYPTTLEDLRHLLRRHFVEQEMTTLEISVPGTDQVMGGVFRHK